MKRVVTWCWREVVSVVVIGALGMAVFELAWLALGLGHAPRSFLLLAGVAMCTWLHPRVCPRRLRAAHVRA